MDFETIDVTVAAGAATVTLNRPQKLNAWNLKLGRELGEALTALSDDRAVRAVLITGAGRAFSSGADLSEPPEPGESGMPDLGKHLREVYHPVITGLREMPKPVVSAVNGPAVGIGCSLALAADLVIASRSAYFLLAFVNIGLVPDGGATAFLPARVSLARAAELIMLGERLPAERALEWGLINRVVDDEALAREAEALLARLAKGPTGAYAEAKALLNRRLYADLEGQLEAEAQAQTRRANSKDFVEGVTAFLQKREPDFSGE